MSKNKGIKNRMIQKYGAIDFLERLHIKIPKIKKYKSKGQMKRMKQLTYHHIIKTSEGRRINSCKWSSINCRTSSMISSTNRRGTN